MKKIVVIGGLNVDLIALSNRIPRIGETVSAKFGGKFQGGKGANQAVAIAKLGGVVTMLGSIGGDNEGRYLLNGLKESGVENEYINIVDNAVTGQAWITINNQGNNAIVVLPGANNNTNINYIESKRSIVENADIVLMQLEIPIETVCHIAKMAKELGKTVVLDPAPATKNLPDELLKNIDYIKPNETELEFITGYSSKKYQDGASYLLDRGVANVIVSLGEKGIYYKTKQNSVIEKPARKVDVVDTTAAGDGFIAAFVLGLAKGMAVDEIIDFAQTVASISVTRMGAQVSIPSADELNEFYTIT